MNKLYMQHQFEVPRWVSGANVYEVNVRQYTAEGTFEAFGRHLTRLKDMGVKILWFMPITPISNTHRIGSLGSYYACSHYNETNPEFGTLNDFKKLVKQAHSLGMKVIIDWVANHTGWDHEWATKHPEFYRKDANGNFFDNHGWSDVIDLDYSNEKLRTNMIKAMKFWISKCDIDGFRCDMAHLVPLDFWERARVELNKTKKDLFWLAETEEVLYHLVFDASYGWELLHTMERLYRREVDLPFLEALLHKYDTQFGPKALHLAFTSNHDENSHSGSEYERMGDAAKAFAVLAATWSNCLPLVYSGQEIRNKKRLLFYDKDQLDWSGELWLHDFYRSLLELRINNPALHDHESQNNSIRIKTTADDVIFAFTRKWKKDVVLVMLNLSPSSSVKFQVDNVEITGKFKSAFSQLTYHFDTEKSFEMNAWEYLVFYKKA